MLARSVPGNKYFIALVINPSGLRPSGFIYPGNNHTYTQKVYSLTSELDSGEINGAEKNDSSLARRST